MAARLLIVSALAALLFSASLADLTFHDGSEKTVVVASDGTGDATLYVISSEDPADVSVSPSEYYTVDSTTPVSIEGGTNYTIQLSMDGGIGMDDIVVSVAGDSVTGKVIVAGLEIYDAGAVVSGSSGAGVSVGQSGTYSFDYKAVGTDGSAMSVSDAMIMQRASDPMMKELDASATKFAGSKFMLALNQYRVGTGKFFVDIEVPSIEYMGMSFETSLTVMQDTTPPPPCVAYGGEYKVSDGKVAIDMFNLAKPPRDSMVSEVVLTIGAASYSWDKPSSDLSVPDQMVSFMVTSSGTASITCDGEDAIIMGDDITIVGGSEIPLAKDNVGTLDEEEGYQQLSAPITIKESDPDILSLVDANAIKDLFCTTISAKSCVITAVTRGSAVLAMLGNVKTELTSQALSNLQDSFDDCSFPYELGYTCNGGDNDLVLGTPQVKAIVGGSAAAAGGLALWTIILIAGLGAFALIAIILLGLVAVYRRSAEQSESDYSSSGPLGVPDPSDLLYEQSIVRDIYGRGDFPEGGPSAAVAEQRAREADLREEFPRPPSSSGLSRGTDDASSTYSV